MPDISKNDSRDFSLYDNMETEELNQIIQADLDSTEEQDIQRLFYITNLLAERDEKSGAVRKTPQQAYAEFREYYDYRDEELTDGEEIKENSEGSTRKNTSRTVSFMKRLPKVAIITIISLGLITALTMSVDAIRKPFMDYVFTQFSHHTTIRFSDEYEEKLLEEDDIFEVVENAPVPDGYFLEKKDIHEGDMVMLRYKNQSDGRISIIIHHAGGVVDYDTEGFDIRNMIICGHEAIVYTKDDGMMIVWVDKHYSTFYFIRTYNMDENSFWEIANYWASKRLKFGVEE